MKTSDKNNTLTCFNVTLKHVGQKMIFEDEKTVAKKLFEFLIREKGLQEEKILLYTCDGFLLSFFPSGSGQDAAQEKVLSSAFLRRRNAAIDSEKPEFIIAADSECVRLDAVKKLQEDFSVLLSIFSHNEKIREFIFQGLDSFPNSIHMYDSNLRLIYANSDFCNYAHIKDRDSAYGKPIDDVLEEVGVKFISIKRPDGDLKVKDVLKYGKPVVDWEVEVKSDANPNEYLFASNDMYPLFDDSGKVAGVVEISRSRSRQIKQLRNALGLAADYTFEDIIGSSRIMLETKKLAMSFAASPYNVLIYGESGVGKELFAQSIHNHSSRRNEPFVAINCASISPELIDSELFGYESGAFTGASKKGHVGKFELANGGTLFLDEVAELPLNAQTKLLRVLETKQISKIGGTKNVSVDVRVIAATNRSLEKMIEEGLFREDLYYRLMVLNITIPPLRERTEDILPCCDFFLRQTMRINNFEAKTFDNEAKKLLVDYDWPGNVRELRNVVSRVYVMSASSVITRETLLASLQSSRLSAPGLSIDKSPEDRLREKRDAINTAQADLIREALLISDGNKTEAARILGVTRKTFYNLLEKYRDYLG